ncbi:MAG: SusD/RagB family nutrient-binding outer membrane lipoprotein [Bernardetiaceae bacterium]
MYIYRSFLLLLLFLTTGLWSCGSFEDMNLNPNEPTAVTPDVLLASAIRSGINISVEQSFLLANNAAQLTAKTLRTEVDAYNWQSPFPAVWEGFYQTLTDVEAVERLAIQTNNTTLEGVALVLKVWIYANLTNAYGDIPYTMALQGREGNFTPSYTPQEEIYPDLLAQLKRANDLLAQQGQGNISGDILLNNDPVRWQKLANSLTLRLLMTASQKLPDAPARFAEVFNSRPIMNSNLDNATLVYTNTFPNQYPLLPLKTGDFDAVAISQQAIQALDAINDPRLFRYARPINDAFDGQAAVFLGAVNGSNSDNCSKAGSRLGVQYYNVPDRVTAPDLALPYAEGILMTYSEVTFLIAEAAAKGWISADAATYYRAGVQASILYHQVDMNASGWAGFNDFYQNSGIAQTIDLDNIRKQKWLALYFHGLEPYFEVRRWYIEEGRNWDRISFLEAPCENLNGDVLPMRFRYPGQEQSLNADNYTAAIERLGGRNDFNAEMWLVR